MVKSMNKKGFVERLQQELVFPEEKCREINDILENNFLIGKSNKDRITKELINRLELTKEEAERVYNKSIEIITNELKEKMKHPFKSQD